MTEKNKKNQPQKSDGYVKTVWKRICRNKRGLTGLIFVGLMLFVTIFSSLLASGQPIVCKYQSDRDTEPKIYFPAIVEIFQFRGDGDHWIKKSYPFNQPFATKEWVDVELAKSDDYWSIWPLIPYSEYESDLSVPLLPAPPSDSHLFGTDGAGRDIAARMIHGTGVSLKVGFISMGIAAFIGIIVGGIAGYWGGWADIIICRVIEIVICFPVFFLILAILAWLEPSITNVMIVIGLTRWTGIARYTRAEFIRLRGSDYVMAAKALGIPHMRIMFRHLLPNSLAPVMVSITFGIAGAILAEAGLSYLGFGVQAPDPSWGNILKEAYDSLRVAPHLVFPPCVAIFLAVLSYNLVGDALRDAIDPRLRNAG